MIKEREMQSDFDNMYSEDYAWYKVGDFVYEKTEVENGKIYSVIIEILHTHNKRISYLMRTIDGRLRNVHQNTDLVKVEGELSSPDALEETLRLRMINLLNARAEAENDKERAEFFGEIHDTRESYMRNLERIHPDKRETLKAEFVALVKVKIESQKK